MSSPADPLPPIVSVAVIGAGPQGRDFAERCVLAGFEVALEDVLSSRLRQAAAEMAVPAASSSLRLATTVEDAVRTADIAIDFVPDELESKLEIFSLLDRMAPPRTLLCTPTELSIADLASCTYRADRCLAVHFGAHDTNGQAVTLICGSSTSASTVSRAAAWFQALGFHVERAADRVERSLQSS